MTFGRPEGGFAKTEVKQYGASAYYCYDVVEFCLQNKAAYDNIYTLTVLGRLDAKNMIGCTEIFMKKEQVLELIRYLEKRITEGDQ